MTSASPTLNPASGTAAVEPRLYALVPCAGVGERAGTTGPKQYEPLAGGSVVGHTLAALAQVSRLSRVLVVLSPSDTRFAALLPDFDGWVAHRGGASRAASVANGLECLIEYGAQATDWVLVHDAARCLIRPEAVDALIDACIDDDVGGLLALPVPDTLKRSGAADARVAATVDRVGMWLAQTPQMFRIGLLREALRSASQAGIAVTDEASAIETLGHAPRLVRGELENLKVTYPPDFELAARLLQSRDTRPQRKDTP